MSQLCVGDDVFVVVVRLFSVVVAGVAGVVVVNVVVDIVVVDVVVVIGNFIFVTFNAFLSYCIDIVRSLSLYKFFFLMRCDAK